MTKRLTAALITSACICLLATWLLPKFQRKSGPMKERISVAKKASRPSHSVAISAGNFLATPTGLPLARGDVDTSFDAGAFAHPSDPQASGQSPFRQTGKLVGRDVRT